MNHNPAWDDPASPLNRKTEFYVDGERLQKVVAIQYGQADLQTTRWIRPEFGGDASPAIQAGSHDLRIEFADGVTTWSMNAEWRPDEGRFYFEGKPIVSGG